jgi:uncharacterized membrane protein
MSNETELKHLQDKLNLIQQKQDTLQSEIILLKTEIRSLLDKPVAPIAPAPIIELIPKEVIEPQKVIVAEKPKPVQNPLPPYIPPPYIKKESDLEKFIGENLISKIGILVVIIGVGIGVKYAIDNNLASPMVRIIFGYLCSIGLLGTAIYLKKKYNSFSAVLFSGGVATAYFTTYFASAFYEFMPKEVAFPIMVLLTVGTIFSAIWYNREVIAHIGLWGAYAVPVLLGSGSNKVEWLYSYMLVINIGIMVLTYKREWKLIFLNAFFSSWAIFIFSSSIDFHTGKTALMELLFASAFFMVFYISVLVNKLVKNINDGGINNAVLVINAFVFASIGSTLVYNINENSDYSALFIFVNGSVYSIAAIISFYKNRESELFKLLSSLAVLSFVVAVPIQFSGMLIPLLWAIIVLGLVLLKKRLKNEYLGWLGLPLLLVVLVGCVVGFSIEIYDVDVTWKAFLRMDFLWSVLIIGSIGTIYKIVQKKTAGDAIKNNLSSTLLYSSAILFGLLVYLLFLTEIICIFRTDYLASVKIMYFNDEISPDNQYKVYNQMVIKTGAIYSIIYTLCFSIILGLMNALYIKHKIFATVHQIINGGLTFIFLTFGLVLLYSLDENYNTPQYPDIYPAQKVWITLRYLAFASFIFLIVSEWFYAKKGFFDKGFKVFLEIVFHFVAIVIISHEIIHWSTIQHIEKLDKYGLSIFWGTYALFLVGYGIWKNRKFLRIEGIVLTGITLVKLFFYDTSNLGTIPKTILFISVGLLLLVISFLYNKYKDLIIDKDNNDV